MNSRFADASQDLAPILSLFDIVVGQCLDSVRLSYVDDSCEKIALNFGSKTLLIAANEDDDSVEVSVENNLSFAAHELDRSQTQPWKDMIGRAFSWGWLIVNQQGYFDGVLISFGPAAPQLSLVVAASSIKVGVVSTVLDSAGIQQLDTGQSLGGDVLE
jgi:hypothetical protein